MQEKIAINLNDVDIIFNMATTLFQSLSFGETLTTEEQEFLGRLYDTVNEEQQQQLDDIYDQVVSNIR